MKNIDVMLSQPGIYVVTSRNETAFVEVDSFGRGFQLELASGTYARDGELRPGRWVTGNIVSIDGPFARAVPPVPAPAPPPAKLRGRARPPAGASTARRPQDDEAFEGMDQDAP